MNMNSPEGLPDAEKTEKQRQWDEIADRIERTVDKLKKGVDERIKGTVVGLNAFDINTTASCEGHADRTEGHAPWIDVEAKEVEDLKAQAKALYPNKEENKEKLKEISQEAERRNLEERRKLFLLLEEFYQKRNVPFHQRLIVEGKALEWSRLQSQGAGLQKIESEEVMKQRLGEYQEEMEAFTEFLKDKFFRE
jgi:hypothetical protein